MNEEHAKATTKPHKMSSDPARLPVEGIDDSKFNVFQFFDDFAENVGLEVTK